MRSVLCLLFVAVSISSCDEEKPNPAIEDKVATTAQSIGVSVFYNEANERSVNVEQITPVIKFTEQTEFGTSCQNGMGFDKITSKSYKSENEYVIEIDVNFINSNGEELKPIIYREMAHLLLDKTYTPNYYAIDPDTQQQVRSIMNRCFLEVATEAELDLLFK